MTIQKPISDQPIPAHAKKIFQGKIFSLWQWQQQQFDGSIKTFEKVQRPDTVGVIPITSDKKIILTKQEQPATKPFIGFPGGIIDEGEHILEAAKRELLEESGYTSDNIILWDAIQPTSKIEWAIYTFVAKDAVPTESMRLDSGEKIQLLMVSFDEFLEVVVQDDFRDKEVAFNILKSLQDDTIGEVKKLFFE